MAACLILAKLDFCKALSLAKFEDRNYVSLYSWFLVNLSISSLTSCTYLIYGGLFHIGLTPCLTKTVLPGLQFILKNWVPSFVWRFIWIYLGIIVAYIIIIYFILRSNTKIHQYFYYGLILLYLMGVGCRGMGSFVNAIECVFGLCG